MLISITTDKTVSQTATDLEASVQAHYFGITQVINFKEIMASQGVDSARECLIYEICQPPQPTRACNGSSTTAFAPCRISIFEEDGKTMVASIRPTMLVTIFAVADQEPVTQDVEDTMVQIMLEAAHGTN